VALFFLFLFTRPSTPTPGVDNGGINFGSIFNPFGNGTTKPPTITPPTNIPENPSNPTPEVKLKLIKISSMPIAGFTVYQKERLKDVPVVIPITASGGTPPVAVAIPTIPYNFGTITLKNGSTGEAVKEIQRFLNNTLNLSLELNGVLDTKTITIIKQWQKDHGLVADGVIGAKTKVLMYSSVNQKTETIIPTPPPTEFMPSLRYVARADGNIYQTFADKIEERKFSVTVIPKIYEAFFGNKGESVIMRYLKGDGKTIETFVGNLPKELLGGDTTVANEVKGSFLPEDIKDVSLSSDVSSVFYLFTVGDSMVGTTLNLTTNKKVQIFDSPFTEWLSLWPNSKMITLTTKPASGIPGYMYAMDPSNNLGNKNLTKIIDGVNGLTTLASPNGKLILYSNDNLSLSIYDTDTKVTDPLGVRTLPEKCVWGKTSDVIFCSVPKLINVGQYPDVWYQGEVSFSDQFWKIDIKTGNATMILDPITIAGGEEIDGIKLAMDEGENYLFFVNKKDSFLWELGLK
jgi:peptidoglycan hydrolase-like protein with peptidoglycan-binding domain